MPIDFSSINYTGIAAVIGAASWIPILIDKLKPRKIRASLIHCRFFDKFYFPILPPDYIGQQINSKDVKFDKYEGTLIVIGINICSTNRDFVVDSVQATLTMDKSEHDAILVSPDVVVPYYSTQDKSQQARLYIPSNMDISKMRNIRANINTRLYMAFICKDINEIKYSNFKNLQIKLIDIDKKAFSLNLDTNAIDSSSLIIDRDIYDVDYAAKISNRQMFETVFSNPDGLMDLLNRNSIKQENQFSKKSSTKETKNG